MKRVDDFRLKLGSQELVPIMVGGMGVDISTADLALEAARLGGVGHISDAMLPTVSDRRYNTKYVKNKLQQYKFNVANTDKSVVQFDLGLIAEATATHVGRTMERKRGTGMVFINCMEKLTMNAPKDTLRVRLRTAMDHGIDGITLAAGLRTQHNAHADVAVDRPVADVVGLAQHIEQSLGDVTHILGSIQVVEHDHEFIAADTGRHLSGVVRALQQVIAAQDRAQSIGHQAQHFVAGAVAQRVVDLLESVAIDEQDGKVVAGVGWCAAQRLVDQLANGRAVGHSSEAVGARGIPQAPGQSLLFSLRFGGGIGQHRHQARLVQLHQADRQHPRTGLRPLRLVQRNAQRFADDTRRRIEIGDEATQLWGHAIERDE